MGCSRTMTGDVKYLVGNTVNNIVITMYSTYQGDHLVSYIPETNIILYVHCKLKIKNHFKKPISWKSKSWKV